MPPFVLGLNIILKSQLNSMPFPTTKQPSGTQQALLVSVGRCLWAAVEEAGVGSVAERWKGVKGRGREREKTWEGEGRRGWRSQGEGLDSGT